MVEKGRTYIYARSWTLVPATKLTPFFKQNYHITKKAIAYNHLPTKTNKIEVLNLVNYKGQSFRSQEKGKKPQAKSKKVIKNLKKP